MTTQLPKTIQEYIDECPTWSDGTSVSSAPMTTMQWRIWWLASAGKFFEGMVVFMMGIALPLVTLEFNLSATQKGMLGAASLFGILIGATALGGLADRFGRRTMFICGMALFIFFLALVVWSPNLPWLVICLFGVGMSLGCDYPTAHLVISESTPSSARGRLVLSAFGFQAIGAIAGTGVGLLVLQSKESVADWRLMYAAAIIPASLVLVGRFFIPQSGHWLVSKKRIAEAEQATAALLRRMPPYPQRIRLKVPHHDAPEQARDQTPKYKTLFSKEHRSATFFASVPWFLQDLGTYL